MITKRLFGEGEVALAVGAVVISFALLVFSEITPKVVGAAHADRLAPVVSYLLGVFAFGAMPPESAGALAGLAGAAVLICVGAVGLAHSPIVRSDVSGSSDGLPDERPVYA